MGCNIIGLSGMSGCGKDYLTNLLHRCRPNQVITTSLAKELKNKTVDFYMDHAELKHHGLDIIKQASGQCVEGALNRTTQSHDINFRNEMIKLHNGSDQYSKLRNKRFRTDQNRVSILIEMCEQSFPKNPLKLDILMNVISDWDSSANSPSSHLLGVSVRDMQVVLGTYARKAIDFDYWVNLWKLDMQQIPDDKTVIVKDVRMDNEAQAVIDLGGMVILIDNVTQSKLEGDAHATEHGVSENLVSGTIFNNPKLDDSCMLNQLDLEISNHFNCNHQGMRL